MESGGAPTGWVPPEGGAPAGTIDAGADHHGVPVLAGSAGVAVARGDTPWPDDFSAGTGSDHGALNDLGPVGVAGVLDGGFDLLRRNFSLLVGLAAALYLPLQLVDLWISLAAGLSADLDTSPLLAAFGMTGNVLPLSWVVVGLRVVALSVLGLAAGVLVDDSLGGRSRQTRAVLGAVGRRWWVALLVPVLCVPVKVVSGCLLYVGFFLGDAFLMCASVAAGAERRGPMGSFARSWRLASRNYGTALGVSLGAFAISVVLQLALYAGPALLTSLFVPSEAVLVAVQQVAMLSMIVTQPLTAAIAARAYVELRCRSEALDLSLRRIELGLVT